MTKYDHASNMKLISTSHRSVKLAYIFLGGRKELIQSIMAPFNSTNTDPKDLKTSQCLLQYLSVPTNCPENCMQKGPYVFNPSLKLEWLVMECSEYATLREWWQWAVNSQQYWNTQPSVCTCTVKAPVFGTLNSAISNFQTWFLRTVMEVSKYCWRLETSNMQCNYNSFIQIINFHGLFRNALSCRKTGACRILVPLRYMYIQRWLILMQWILVSVDLS